MSSPSATSIRHWGHLVKPDRCPSPLLEQLLLGVANYINQHVAPWDIHCLTPSKLATFYRLVGGDYDPLFLDMPSHSLSFIYKYLGCFHTLQPEQDPYKAPSIPALTPQGFVRWQTIQLLLDPDEHAPFLQQAVKRFEITNPADGEPFPSILPREAFPSKPDPQMVEWHDNVSQKLMTDAQQSSIRSMPPRPPLALSDGKPEPKRRPSTDDRKIGDRPMKKTPGSGATNGFSPSRSFSNGRAHAPVPASAPTTAPGPTLGSAALPRKQPTNPGAKYPNHPPPVNNGPWSPLRRRSSMPPDKSYKDTRRSSTIHATNYPSERFPENYMPTRRSVSHSRTTSSLSTDSYTSDSSYTTSSASLSPVLAPVNPMHPTTSAPPNFNRRHSTFHPQPIRPYGNIPSFLKNQHLPQHHQHHHHHHHHHHRDEKIPLPNGETGSCPVTVSGSRQDVVEKGWGNVLSTSSHPQAVLSSGSSPNISTATNSPEHNRIHRSSTIKASTLGPEVYKEARNARSADGRCIEKGRDQGRDRTQTRGQSVGAGRTYRDERPIDGRGNNATWR